MKKLLLTYGALAIALTGYLSTSAYATPLVDNSCQGISCNTDNSVNNSATGGAGGAGGSAVNGPNVNTNVNTAKGGEGGSAKIERGAVDVDVDNDIHNSVRSSNKNTNRQKQSQSQGQSQEAYSSSRSSVKGSGNSDVDINYERNTASAYSPALVASSETCVQSQSAGAQGPAFGISLGFSHTNEGCEMRRNAGMLFALGNKGAAIELLCQDDDIRAALLSAGTPCREDLQQVPAPSAENEGFAKTAKQAALEPMSPIAE